MNEMHFGNKIRQALNQGLRLDQTQIERLRAARERALARQRPEPAPALAWADNVVGSLGGWSGVSLRLVAPLVALVVSVAALYSWQQNRVISDFEEIDSMLLADDLPIDAYLDRGFQNWLKKRAAEQ
jgi:cytochrome c-type biogenesis protein CcmH/NrfG